MLTRRLFVAAGLVARIRPAEAAELRSGQFTVGVLFGGIPPSEWFSEFVRKLEDLGYVDGKNLRLETRAANGHYELLPGLAAELDALHLDVILATTTPSVMALYKADCKAPVIFIGGFNPLKLGIIQSISHPGGNYTGVINNGSDINGKRLQILRELLPEAHQIVCFLNPANSPPAALASVREEISRACEKLDFQMDYIEVSSAEELPKAFTKATEQRAQAFFGVADPVYFSHRREIFSVAYEHRLPAIYNFRIEAADGGLIAYGADMEGLYRGAAIFADKILRGEKPADLPVEETSKLKLVLNLNTARGLNLAISPTLLAQADEVIE